MANLDITEKRVPQDGRIKMKLGRKREVDFRVSSLPTLFGESVVLRILDKSGLNVDLTKLGFTQKNLSQFMKAVQRPNGFGSGHRPYRIGQNRYPVFVPVRAQHRRREDSYR
jgi:type IV pilus assembly protein PilB